MSSWLIKSDLTLVIVSIAAIRNYDLKQFIEETACFYLQPSGHTLPLKEVRARTQDRNLKAGIETEATEKNCLLTCPWQLAQTTFLYNSGPCAQGWHLPCD